MPFEPAKDGDIAFIGLNSRDNPASLPQGSVSKSQNFRLDRGVATTRKGLQRKTIGSLLAQTIYGTGTYVQNDGQEVIILVVANGLYTYNPQTEVLSSKVYFPNLISGKTFSCSDSQNVTVTSTAHGLNVGDYVYVETTVAGYSGLFVITYKTTNTFTYMMASVASYGAVTNASCNYSASELITTPDGCDVCTAMDKVFITRGYNKRPLVWDMVGSITALPITSSNDSGHKFPNCTSLMYYGNRLIACGKYHLDANDNRNYDTVSVSNFLDYTDWDAADAFTINNGSNDHIIGVSPWTLNEFLVFMRNSIFYVSVGDDRYATGAPLSSNSYVRSLATDIGCSAKKSVVQAGGGVFFLSDNGVYFLQPQPASTDSMKLLTMSDPISSPIDDVIQRINRDYAYRAVATYWNNRYYLAVPLDDSTVNNSVLVYNFILKAWESVDTYPTLVSTKNTVTADNWLLYTSGPLSAADNEWVYVNISKSSGSTRHGLAVGDYVNVNFGPPSYRGPYDATGYPPSGTYKVLYDQPAGIGFADTYFVIKIPTSSFIYPPYAGNYNWNYTGGTNCTFSKAESISLKDFIVVKKNNQRRMFLVDNAQGIFLTEELDWDEFGDSLGDPILPSPLTSDTASNIALGRYGNLILVAPTDTAGNPNANVIVLNPLAFTKNDIQAILQTRKYSFQGIGDKRFSSYVAEMVTAGGDYIETYADVSNPDVYFRVDAFGSAGYEDYVRANPIRKTGSGMSLKFISHSRRPSIRSVFVNAQIQKHNNLNKK